MTWQEFLDTPVNELPWWAFTGVCLVVSGALVALAWPGRNSRGH